MRAETPRRADGPGVPERAVNLASRLRSPDGRACNERLATVKTGRELGLVLEDFVDAVPLGRRRFATRSSRDAG